MDSTIIVLSYGALVPSVIVKELIEINGDAAISKNLQFENTTVASYAYRNKTKYYENNLMLIPFDGDIDSLPHELLKITESLIVYFDAANRSFLKDIPALCKLLSENNIEMGLFLTSELFDDSELGLTYKEVKMASNMQFDIIELIKPGSDDEETNSKQHGCNEVHYAIQNHIWSNVKHPKLKGNNTTENEDCDTDNMEEQLELFAELLVSIQNFKKMSSTLGREEVLNQAEKFAELFTNIINEDRD